MLEYSRFIYYNWYRYSFSERKDKKQVDCIAIF